MLINAQQKNTIHLRDIVLIMRYAITKVNVLCNLVLFIFPPIAPTEPAIHSNDENKQSKFKYLAE